MYEFGFQPASRPLIGEPTLQLTGGTVIDCRVRTTPAVTLAAPTTTIGVAPINDGAGFYIDVLFAPSGKVMFTPGGIICLWVAALVTLWTGYDYLRAALRHAVEW